MLYVTQASPDVPAASPSRPSVRFTALDMDIITKIANNGYPTIPKSGLKEVKGIATAAPSSGEVATYSPKSADNKA